MKEFLDLMLADLKREVEAKEARGEDMRVARAQFGVIEAEDLCKAAMERIKLHAESEGADTYSAQAAAKSLREAAALLIKSAETLEAVADPHGEVLKSAGIENA